MNEQFPWTESGIKCLEAIYASIKQAGGRVPMAYHIIEENPESFTPHEKQQAKTKYLMSLRRERFRDKQPVNPATWTQEDVEFMMSNWGQIKPRNMAVLLGRTVQAIQKKRDLLLKNGDKFSRS